MEYDSTWVEEFISVMESKPVLYNKNADGDNKLERTKAWKAVCEAVIHNWKSLNQEDKELKASEVQRRWKNLRTCFARELRNQRHGVMGYGGKRPRRKYIFYDQLMFLKPYMEERDTSLDFSKHITKEEESDLQLQVDEIETLESVESMENMETITQESQHSQPTTSRRSRKRQASNEEFLLYNLQVDSRRDEIDEDETFLLSLLPGLKRMKEESKCEAKIEMLRVIHRCSSTDYRPIDYSAASQAAASSLK